ncbi:hypothetical protein MNEG_12756 [Monoraphidium neglectum]|uniref:Uncharacterized protein n=1 Tax=Monoraphidium neglectum TaxID=145388 RepID=A0A0D2MJU1_9CHLO|nr:hypothetical protein MNEG_12756 [Monoraphidium neglectum]KIY95205.1 hypothetical protein MNEG_12756 [Monoraphidium neglectum]|eukprot:XP_013894225.1 hypothetical protein MNEG_12756 [Monoraphidium neglectum]
MKLIVAAAVAFVVWQALPIEWAPAPITWVLASAAAWTAHLQLRSRVRPWGGPLTEGEKLLVGWGYGSCVFLMALLEEDPSFQGWGDVYFFCGRDMQYCTCDFRWNKIGWFKAAVLWNFVLSSALGAQRLLVQLALNGFLPGEESVTFESFVSVCWRLVPYYLNQWEAKWGAECTSMMFELPHFATELLIVLPFVQILVKRLKILAASHVSAQLPPGQPGMRLAKLLFAPDVMAGRCFGVCRAEA